MVATPRLQCLTPAELDALIGDLRQEGTPELVLLGPAVQVPDSPQSWRWSWQRNSVIYQLTEFVDGLAEKLRALPQLTSLDLEGNNIGAVGAASLAVLLT
jgi:hypothetical protein